MFGFTPLHYAATHGRVEAAKVLIEKGAALHLEDEDGHTALELAKKSGYSEIAEMIERSMKRTKFI